MRWRWLALVGAALFLAVFALVSCTPTSIESPPPATVRPVYRFPPLTEWSGGLTIGPGFNGQCSAPYVYRAGVAVGVYIDDTTPDIAKWVACAVAEFPHGTVLVAVAPGQRGLRYRPRPPVVNCFEAYPYGYGDTLRDFLPLPRYGCYIVQWLYNWGKPEVSAAKREALLAHVEAKHPSYVFLY